MKILVACELPEFAIDELRSLGNQVLYHPNATSEQLPKLVGGVAVLIVNRTPVTAETIVAGISLQMIVRAGTDTSQIAVDDASTQGVFVCNAPHRAAVAIAEMFFGFALTLDRRLHELFSSRGGADSSGVLPRGLADRSLGCLGYGAVGREICRRAIAFGMEPVVWSPRLTPEQAVRDGLTCCAWPRDVAKRCDIIANCDRPDVGDERILNAEFVQQLRDGSIVVHIGDWASIDDAALAEAVARRGISVGIDLATEPPRGRSRLLDLPNVLTTHRHAARTDQARRAIAAEAVRVVRKFLVTGVVENCVNQLERSPATWQLVLRLKDAVGVMAGIMETIRSDGVNAEEITTRVFIGARAASCVIALDERPSAESLAAIRSLPEVLHLELRAVV
ncbi:MAG: hypothetical protein HZB38_14220 [Planctomycetes bacterium]|nr:hypothetical protein [Planctomycetota bacterium]